MQSLELVRLAAVFISNISMTTFLFPSLTINLFAHLIIYGSSLFIEANNYIYLFIYLFICSPILHLFICLDPKRKENKTMNCGPN